MHQKVADIAWLRIVYRKTILKGHRRLRVTYKNESNSEQLLLVYMHLV